jgi:hypothetical protein
MWRRSEKETTSVLSNSLSILFKVLWNRFKTSKYPDENPNLPTDFKNLDRKPKVEEFCQMFVIAKKKSRTLGKDLEVKNLEKYSGESMEFIFLWFPPQMRHRKAFFIPEN